MLARSTAVISLLCLVLGCSEDDKTTAIAPQTRDEVVGHYAELVHAGYGDSVTGAEDLLAAIKSFVAAPSADGLAKARKAWLAARPAYLQTEVFRFYDGPIDNPEDGPEGYLNAWPLDEAHIDSVEDDATTGIVNDASITIDEEGLRALNESPSEESIATGYHAIEFLLWGQDLSDDGPGDRPYTDYVTGDDATAPNADRRAKYLTTVAEMLVADLKKVRAAWAPDADNYRSTFMGDEALEKMLTGMIVLSGFEMGSERLQAALDSLSQEDEHSCFSDNTHVDMQMDVQGIENVYLGQYKRVDGTTLSGAGVYDVLATLDSKLSERLKNEIATSVANAEKLVPPFDKELRTDAGKQRIRTLIDSLLVVEGGLQDVFQQLGFTVPQPE